MGKEEMFAQQTVNSEHNLEESTDNVSVNNECFKQCARSLQFKGLEDSLVQCLFSRCLFTSHAAKKALLSGLHSKHIQMDDILVSLSQDLESQSVDSLSRMFGFLRTLCSQEETHFTMFKNIQAILKCGSEKILITEIFEIDNSIFEGLMEFTWFVQVLSKRLHSSFKEIAPFVHSAIIPKLLSTLKPVLCATNFEKKHLVSSKILKALSAVLDMSCLEMRTCPDEVVRNVARALLDTISTLDVSFKHGKVLETANFVGNKQQKLTVRDDMEINQPSSSYNRLFFHTALKACAILVFSKSCPKDASLVNSTLQCKLSPFLPPLMGTQHPLQRLSLVFGDHDQMWIDALFCLHLIYNQTCSRMDHADKDRHESPNKCHPSEKRTDPDSLPNIWRCLNPFVLFLDFVSFIDWDHLAIADFLISPETYFLAYFILLLHHIKTDWDQFKVVCSVFQSGKSLQFSDVSCETSHKGSEFLHGKTRKRTFSGSSHSFDHPNPKESHLELTGSEMNNTNTNYTFSTLVSYSDSEESDSSDSFPNPNDFELSSSEGKSKENESIDLLFKEATSVTSHDMSLSGSTAVEESVIGVDGTEILDRVMGMIIRLRFHLERLKENKLAPFDVSSLICLIVSCENVYENV